MDPTFGLVSGLISGGLNLLGSAKQQQQAQQNQLMAQAFNQQEAATARAFNRQEASTARDFAESQGQIARDFSSIEAEKARDFSERMSSTAFQRSMQDMKTAGLNPILAYQKGGASTPGAASAGASNVSGPAASGGAASTTAAPAFNLMQGVMSSALEAMRFKPQMDQLEEQTRFTRGQADITTPQWNVVNQQYLSERERTAQLEKQNLILDENVQIARREATKAKADEQRLKSGWSMDKIAFDKPFELVRDLGQTLRDFNPFMSNARTLHQMSTGN